MIRLHLGQCLEEGHPQTLCASTSLVVARRREGCRHCCTRCCCRSVEDWACASHWSQTKSSSARLQGGKRRKLTQHSPCRRSAEKLQPPAQRMVTETGHLRCHAARLPHPYMQKLYRLLYREVNSSCSPVRRPACCKSFFQSSAAEYKKQQQQNMQRRESQRRYCGNLYNSIC